jgi:predicted CoA-binding protein
LSENEIREILKKYNVIAVVGLSRDEDKPSHEVAAYMKGQGYRVIPVNPFVDEVLGEKSYKSLLEMPADLQRSIDIVNIFRPSSDILPIFDQIIKLKAANGKPYVVWTQLGIVNDEAAETARKAGLIVVMDRCIMVEHHHISVNSE